MRVAAHDAVTGIVDPKDQDARILGPASWVDHVRYIRGGTPVNGSARLVSTSATSSSLVTRLVASGMVQAASAWTDTGSPGGTVVVTQPDSTFRGTAPA